MKRKYTERKYVEVHAFLDRFENALNQLERTHGSGARLGFTDILILIRRTMNITPAADVVPVVYCKDCKHAQRQYLKKACCEGWICEFDQEHFTPAKHFCGFGERREKSE